MKRFQIGLFILALMAFVPIMKAQDISPVSFMRLNPYQTNLNVATDLPYNAYFSPGMGNVGVNLQYSQLGIRDLFKSGFNLSDLLDLLEDDNYISINLHHNLQTLGIRVGNGMLSYNHNFRVRGYASFNYCLFKLLAFGSMEFLGEDNPANVKFDLDTQAFHEYALGYQCNVTDWLSLGVRAKLVFGLFDITTDAFAMKLYTDPESNILYVNEDVRMCFALPRLFQLEEGQLTTQGPFGIRDFYHNSGFGLDLAASVRIGDRFIVTTAVNDLGYITWKENNMQLMGLVNEGGEYNAEGTVGFDGFDAEHLKLFFTDEEYRSAVLDTLNESFDFQTTSIGEYKTMLPTSFLMRGSFDLNEYNRFIAQFQGCFRGDSFRPAFTVAYNGCFFKKIDLCGTYTMMKGSYATLGLGLGFKFGAFQMYAASSNWLNLNTGGSKVRNYQAGIVFSVGEVEKKKNRRNSQLYME